jgi:hypothetical protein
MKSLTTVLLALLACAAMAADTDESKTVQNKEKSVQITLPKGWKITDFPDGWSKSSQDRGIAAESPDGAYVLVESGAKKDFPYRTLKEFAEAGRVKMMKDPGLEDKVLTDLRTVKVNGADALQSGLHGTSRKARLVTVYTFFDTPTRWTQIEVLTEQSRLDKLQDQIDAIDKSFKELPKEQESKESPQQK